MWWVVIKIMTVFWCFILLRLLFWSNYIYTYIAVSLVSQCVANRCFLFVWGYQQSLLFLVLSSLIVFISLLTKYKHTFYKMSSYNLILLHLKNKSKNRFGNSYTISCRLFEIMIDFQKDTNSIISLCTTICWLHLFKSPHSILL